MAQHKNKYGEQESGKMESGGRGPQGGYQKPKNVKQTVSRLLGYLTQNKLLLAAVFACLVLSSVGSIASTYILRPIINGLVEPGLSAAARISNLASSLALFAAIFIGAALFSYLQSAIMVRLAQRATNKLRQDLFNKLQDMPLSYFDAHTHGELMSRFTNDADNVSVALEQSLVSLISSALTFIGLVAVMLYTSPILFIITALTLAATLFSIKVIGSKSQKAYRAQQSALGQVNGNIQEMIEGLKVVKAFNHEDAAKAEFKELNENYRVAGSHASFFGTSLWPLTANIINIGYALTAVVGGFLALVAGFDVGGFAIYLQYSKQVGQPMNQVSQQINVILSALAGAERIFEIMDAEPEIDEGNVTLTPVTKDENGNMIETTESVRSGMWAWRVPNENGFDLVELKGAVMIKDVDFSYVPDKPVLKDVSFYAKPGQKIAFVGSTGAGKTTITNLINRFYEIDGGTITYDGIDIRDIKKDDLRRSMGAVLQDTHLFTGTVMDNIRYGRLDATDEECVAAAKTANAHNFIRRLPDGYNTMVTGDGSNLSQGQRQLLAIARASVKDPAVMVLDEATSSIDTRTEQHIEKGMDALMQGRTVFVIAHRLSTVRNSNCIVVIEGGQIEEKGDHSELLENKGRYYMLYTGQNVLS